MRIGNHLSGPGLTAQRNLLNALSQLSLSSMRLATMRRINRGSDDPAGLIALEQMQAELTAIGNAQDNASRAAGLSRAADAALGEVSDLLVSVRGNLVAAAGGGLSDAERAALQLEVDAALEAIDRIGNTTSYGGRKLLDGSAGTLTFVFSPDVSQTSTLELPEISAAALGTADGRLSDLASGGTASLTSGNLAEAADLLDAARGQVLDARATAGAFEKYAVESSRHLLAAMEENLSAAASAIGDTDVALESSRLLRSQLLVHSAMSALSLAAARPRQVAALLDALS